MRSLTVWLNETQVPTVTGGTWHTSTVRNILKSPRYAGLITHRGQVVGPGVWEAIISEDDHRRLLSRFELAKTSGRRAPQRYLLSALLKCGKCGNGLFSSVRHDTRRGTVSRRYVCMAGPDHGGCGKLTVVADPLERLLADAVLFRLDTPELADHLAGRSNADERIKDLAQVVERAQAQIDELSLAYGNGETSMREWQLARQAPESRLAGAQQQIAAASGNSALTGLVGSGSELTKAWSGLNLSRQVAIVRALVDHVVIAPVTRRSREFDPSRVSVVWRH